LAAALSLRVTVASHSAPTRHAVVDVLLGGRRVGHQHAPAVDDPAIQPLLALVHPLEHQARDQGLEGAAHREALVAAMGEGLAVGGVQHGHAQPAAAAGFQGGHTSANAAGQPRGRGRGGWSREGKGGQGGNSR
jgi:hypothetical protein